MTRFFPLGTVCMLNPESEIRLMIIARAVKETIDDDKVWDYCGCPSPEGFTGPESFVFFNHEDVKHLVFIGLQDEKELQIAEVLAKWKKGEIELPIKGGTENG